MGRAGIIICGLLLAGVALAADPPKDTPLAQAGRTALVGGGDCQDPELVGYLRSFAEKLRPRFGAGMVELNTTAERLRPTPRVAADEVARQLENAQAQFYAAEFKKAETLVEGAMRELAALPFGEKRSKLRTDALLLRMMLAREQRQTKAMEEAMQQVLRLRSDFKLDPVYFSPAVRADFEQQRKKLRSLPRAELSVRSSPSAADVYLDGVKVGRSPVKLSLPQGAYALQVVKGAASSFVKSLELRAATQVLVDLDFEGSVSTQPVPCISERDDGALLTKSVRLGSMVDVEQLVVLAVERPSAGPSWLTATLVSIERGQKARQAGFKARGDASSEAALADLAEFIATGQATKNVVVAQTSDGPQALSAPAPAPWSPPPAQVASAPSGGMRLPTGPRRILLFAGGGAAVVGFAGAGVMRLMAQSELDELSGRLTSDGRLVTGDERASALTASLQTRGTMITGLLILGGVGVGATAAALLWPQAPQELALAFGPDDRGWNVGVRGTF